MSRLLYRATKWLLLERGVVLLICSFVLVHLAPFVRHGHLLVLGFDTGFYRRYLIEPLSAIPHASVPGLDHTVILPRAFMDIVRLSGLPTDVVLYGSYLLAAGFMLCMFYRYVTALFDSTTALYATFLVLFAPVYFHGYWFFLFKNFLALGIFFWLLLALRNRQWLVVTILALCIPITHQSTTVIAGIVLFLDGILGFVRRQQYVWSFVAWGILTGLYFVYHPTVAAKIAAPPRAIFLEWNTFLSLTAPLLVLVTAALPYVWRTLWERRTFFVFVFTCVLFLAFTLPYYQRLFFFSIFALAPIGALFLAQRFKMRYIIGYLLLYALYGGVFIWTTEPYLSKDTAESLRVLDTLPADSHVITTNYLAPWVHGYTRGTVYAPGLFKDPYAPHDWEFYWMHENLHYERAFLDAYPQPLYFFVPIESGHYLPLSACREHIEGPLYRYTCYNSGI